jgi:hypothetical protein
LPSDDHGELVKNRNGRFSLPTSPCSGRQANSFALSLSVNKNKAMHGIKMLEISKHCLTRFTMKNDDSS